MNSVNISDIKTFMGKLLTDTTFDEYLVEEVSITTYNTFNINGHLHKPFFTSEEYNLLEEKELSRWSSLKPICYQIIKGKKTPSKFLLVFKLPIKHVEQFLTQNGIDINNVDEISGLYMNIRFENGTLDCISATSLKSFTLDKTIEKAFDSYAEKIILSSF